MRRYLARIAVLLAFGASGVSAQADRAPRVLGYGSDSLSVGELTLPDGGGPFPIAVLLHGGCWSARLGSIDGMRRLAASLVDSGVATWNMEYRRVGHPGGGWPGTYQDLSAGTDYVRTLASEFPVDTSRVVVVGHSSGGYFAGWVAGRRNLPRDSPLREGPSLAVSGIVVADAFMDPFIIDSKGVNGAYYCGSPMLEVLVGGDPRVEAGQFSQVSPLELLPYGVRQEYVISSSRYPSRDGEPLAGGRTTHPVADYPALARAAGDRISVTVLQDAGHFEFTDPETEPGGAVIAAVLRLLSRND